MCSPVEPTTSPQPVSQHDYMSHCKPAAPPPAYLPQVVHQRMSVPVVLMKRAATLVFLHHLALFLVTSTSTADGPAASIAHRRRQVLLREKATLLALKRGFTMPSPSTLADWNESNGHVCSFTGVACDRRRGHVVGLNLANTDISGTIPEAIGGLSHLRSLDVSNNSFSGVPASMGNLTRLQRLFMNYNRISGAVPAVISDLSQLRNLDISYNRISGIIPPALGGLGLLQTLNISSNNIFGAIPPSFANLTLLEALIMDNNIISGGIPLAICNLTGLYSLDMSSNNLTGQIPAELSNLGRNIGALDLSNNQLYGEIPPSLSDLTVMFYLNLHHNNLSGHIPAAIFLNCTGLGVFDVGNNGLSGAIPSMASSDTLAAMFAVLNLYSNRLTGKLPRWLANCTYLTVLDVGNNSLADELPTSIVSGKNYLQYLDLSSNQFWGHDGGNNILEPFFVAVSNSSREYRAASDWSKLPLPWWLTSTHWPPQQYGALSQLAVVLSDNALTGEIPPCIGNVTTSLGELDLSGNMLWGSIPSSIGSLPWIRVLSLQRNMLSGEIPASLGRCASLMRLDLSSNLLTGSLMTVDAD